MTGSTWDVTQFVQVKWWRALSSPHHVLRVPTRRIPSVALGHTWTGSQWWEQWGIIWHFWACGHQQHHAATTGVRMWANGKGWGCFNGLCPLEPARKVSGGLGAAISDWDALGDAWRWTSSLWCWRAESVARFGNLAGRIWWIIGKLCCE